MEALTCKSCHAPATENAVFCYNCGLQLKCKSCHDNLVAGANHCVSCGTAVVSQSESALSPSLNTIKFRENKEERFYEILFTNDVGKEIKEVVADLLKNKLSNGTDKQFTIQEDLNPSVSMPVSEPAADVIMETGNVPTNLTAYSEQEPVGTENMAPVDEYPHLNDLDIKLNCKENEWLLLFAFYSSNFGTTTFTKNAVWQLYKDKRLTETRFKNLGTNWKTLFKKYICTVKDNEFRFTSSGLQKVKALLRDTEEGKKVNQNIRKGGANVTGTVTRNMQVSRKVIADSIVPNEFDVYRNDLKPSLEEFFSQKQPGNGNPNRIVAIAYYITKVNHQEYFTEGNIDYAYRILNLAGKPAHLKQIIVNLKNDRIWFQKVIDRTTSGWKLTRQGEIYVEEKMKSDS